MINSLYNRVILTRAVKVNKMFDLNLFEGTKINLPLFIFVLDQCIPDHGKVFFNDTIEDVVYNDGVYLVYTNDTIYELQSTNHNVWSVTILK